MAEQTAQRGESAAQTQVIWGWMSLVISLGLHALSESPPCFSEDSTCLVCVKLVSPFCMVPLPFNFSYALIFSILTFGQIAFPAPAGKKKKKMFRPWNQKNCFLFIARFFFLFFAVGICFKYKFSSQLIVLSVPTIVYNRESNSLQMGPRFYFFFTVKKLD